MAPTPKWSPPDSEAARVAIRVLGAAVPALAAALGPDTELVLHDLRQLPNSVVAVGGSVTGRRDGSPTSDLLLRQLHRGRFEDLIGYATTAVDGRPMRSSSVFLKDENGVPFGSLCFNVDISQYARVQETMQQMAATVSLVSLVDDDVEESFVDNIEQLAEGIVQRAISVTTVPVHLMEKSHRLAVVANLDERGFFALRDSVEFAARALGISRYSIYKYLNEIRAQTSAGDAATREAPSNSMPSVE